MDGGGAGRRSGSGTSVAAKVKRCAAKKMEKIKKPVVRSDHYCYIEGITRSDGLIIIARLEIDNPYYYCPIPKFSAKYTVTSHGRELVKGSIGPKLLKKKIEKSDIKIQVDYEHLKTIFKETLLEIVEERTFKYEIDLVVSFILPIIKVPPIHIKFKEEKKFTEIEILFEKAIEDAVQEFVNKLPEPLKLLVQTFVSKQSPGSA